MKRIIHNGMAIFKKQSFKAMLGDLDSEGSYLITRHSSISDLRGLPLDSQFESWKQAIAARNASYTAVDSSTGRLDIGDRDLREKGTESCGSLGKKSELPREETSTPWLPGTFIGVPERNNLERG